MPGGIERAEGRRLFGGALPEYRAARPPYPERIYDVLRERCGLGSAARVLEIGAGAGAVTARLVELCRGAILAVEPDPRLARHLVEVTRPAGARIEVLVAAFEDVRLSAASFDLAVAATSFHWVEPESGLARVAAALRPGGWWAMWWTVFGDPSRPDPFRAATDPLLRDLPPGPSAAGRGGSFALDVEARRADLAAAGRFERVESEVVRWDARLGAAEVRALYATFSSIGRLPGPERERLLDEISRIASDEFGGRVERPFVTVLYTAQRREGRGAPG